MQVLCGVSFSSYTKILWAQPNSLCARSKLLGAEPQWLLVLYIEVCNDPVQHLMENSDFRSNVILERMDSWESLA